jgi:hypothetical protein
VLVSKQRQAFGSHENKNAASLATLLRHLQYMPV